MIRTFRKKPVEIQAVQWTGTNLAEIAEFVGEAWINGVTPNPPGDDLIVDTLEGEMRCRAGDWLIQGVAGEFYPCKPVIFAATYEPSTESETPQP